MATIHIPSKFKEFLQSLNARKVDYLLIGGYPVSFYGYPRATADIDIWIRVSKTNATRLAKALVDYGFNAANVSPKIFLRRGPMFRIGVPPLRIEILTSISGVTFSACY